MIKVLGKVFNNLQDAINNKKEIIQTGYLYWRYSLKIPLGWKNTFQKNTVMLPFALKKKYLCT